MIFGPTNSESYEAQRRRVAKVYAADKPQRFFALLPRELNDGRFAWLEYVWRIRCRDRQSTHVVFSCTRQYFLERDDAQNAYEQHQYYLTRFNLV